MSDLVRQELSMSKFDSDSDGGLVSDEVVEALLEQVNEEGVDLLGPSGVLTELTSKLLSKAMQVELDDELGYVKGDPAGRGSGNSRNGFSSKTLLTDAGEVPVQVPRDRNGVFESVMVPKHKRRLSGFNDMILGLVSRGMSTRDVVDQMFDTYGVEISPELVSKVTDAIQQELDEWMTRPLDEIYPIVYLDALVVKVRTDRKVANRPVYLALGVNVDGEKDILGIELGDGNEGAKFWLSFLTKLKNRGVKDILITCCDGLTGFEDAINTVWERTVVQTCVVHLIRNSMKYVNYKNRREIAKDLKPIYQAVDEKAAEIALAEFDDKWGEQYQAAVQVWYNAWDRFIPFLDWEHDIRKVIYTTNAVESVNYQLRKVIKTKGSFPTDQSVYKLLYLAIRNISTKRKGGLGTHTKGWKQAMNQFKITWPERIK